MRSAAAPARRQPNSASQYGDSAPSRRASGSSQYRDSAPSGRASGSSQYRDSAPSRRAAASSSQRRANQYNNQTIQYKKRKKKKKHSRAFFILMPIVIILLAFLVFAGIRVSILKNKADNVKNDLEMMLDHIKDKDVQSAEKDLENSYKHREALEDALEGSFWTTAAKVPRIGQEINGAKELVNVLKAAQDELLTPLLALMKEKPLTGLRVGDNGFNVRLINSYLDFLDTVHPQLLDLTKQIENMNGGSVAGGLVGKYRKKLLTYMEAYTKASDLLPVVRSFLGNGEDKLYLLVAQNSAEIRASGGFPGSIGTIKITNGLLSIGDFKSVYKVLSGSISQESEVTDADQNLFGSWVYAPRDACFIPAFEKTARIWAVAYEDMQRENGAQDRYDDGSGDPDNTDSWDDGSWDENWDENWDDYDDSHYDPSAYESRLSYYSNTPSDTENYDGENMDTGGKKDDVPNPQDAGDFEVGAYLGDGSIYYSFNNDFYGYGGLEQEYVEYVDGVVSLTPAIIQMLLGEVGEVTLSDGTTLNGENATKVLQYDLYHKYFDEDTFDSTSNRKSDRLFAETAKTVMKEFVGSFDVSKFADYFEMFKDAVDKNIVMMWLKDAEQEALLDKLGVSGKLNYIPDEPRCGVYFSLADPSKMGWYLDIDTEISDEYVTNYDGTRTYDAKVTLTNTITEEDIMASAVYIIGSYNGAIRGFVHIFSPAGGRVSNFDTPDDIYIMEDTYQGLSVGYNLDLLIDPGESIEINYKITTGSFVDTPPKMITTPTLTEYR